MSVKLYMAAALLVLPLAAPAVYSQIVNPGNDSPALLRQNADLFLSYGDNVGIDDRLTRPDSKSPHATNESVTFVDQRHSRTRTYSELRGRQEAYIQLAVANSDVIIVGDPLERHSGLTARKDFIFSDYTVVVRSVINSHGVTLLPGQHIVVTRPGGTLIYKGLKIGAHVFGFQLFHLNEPYLFCLRQLANGTFLVYSTGSYNIESPTTHVGIGTTEERDIPVGTLISDVQTAIKHLTGEAR